MRANLDMDCLRTFVTIVDAGNFAEAAERVGRTASAVSLQIKRLEEQAGQKLFRRSGRRMTLDSGGERLLSTARQILELNDRVVEALSHQSLAGEVRIGAIQDIADAVLPSVLSRYKASHPDVQITARVDRTKTLADAIDKGMLDLAVGIHGWSGKPHQKVRREPMMWFGAKDFVLSDSQPIPLVVFEPPCTFREAAINSLNEAGREWEIVFIGPSLSGLRAATEAGLGVTARSAISFQGNLQALSRLDGLPKLPNVDFAVYAKPNLTAPAERLRQIIVQQIAAPSHRQRLQPMG